MTKTQTTHSCGVCNAFGTFCSRECRDHARRGNLPVSFDLTREEERWRQRMASWAIAKRAEGMAWEAIEEGAGVSASTLRRIIRERKARVDPPSHSPR